MRRTAEARSAPATSAAPARPTGAAAAAAAAAAPASTRPTVKLLTWNVWFADEDPTSMALEPLSTERCVRLPFFLSLRTM